MNQRQMSLFLFPYSVRNIQKQELLSLVLADFLHELSMVNYTTVVPKLKVFKTSSFSHLRLLVLIGKRRSTHLAEF